MLAQTLNFVRLVSIRREQADGSIERLRALNCGREFPVSDLARVFAPTLRSLSGAQQW